MEEQKKVIIAGIVFVLLIVAAALIYYFFIYSKPQESAETTPISQEQPVVEEKVLPEEEEIEPLDVDLDESDDVVRKLVGKLSSHPKLAMWLMSEELVRKFVAAVDNIANGHSPKPQIDFFKPEGNFEVIQEEGEYFIDPESYKRYDIVAEVFASLDPKGCVVLYKQLKPAIQEAYKELGYPDTDFDITLKKAITELLRVPVVEDNIKLEKKVVTYVMADSDLESLSSAQKNLFRMGPDSVRLIQEKLRSMAMSLGFAE
jgi:aryl carrier-like protein